MYAVIGIGGKQMRVSPGETVRVETLPVDPGTSVTFDQVLMIGGETGTLVGTPVVAGAKVLATVLEHDRAKKVLIFKKKKRKQYRRTNGHRQSYTAVRIEDIETGTHMRSETATENLATGSENLATGSENLETSPESLETGAETDIEASTRSNIDTSTEATTETRSNRTTEIGADTRSDTNPETEG